MADIEVQYKGTTIKSQTGSGTVTLHTEGKYCEDDIDIVYTAPSGPTEPESLNVDFIDYDGTLLYSYSTADFLALSAMPTPPTHTGLTGQGWNWTLVEAQTYVAKYHDLVIGATYKSTDHKTHIFIDLAEPMAAGNLKFTMRFTTTVKGGVTIDWGDGTTEASTANANAVGTYTHEYATLGQYEIVLTVTSGSLKLNSTTSGHSMFYYGLESAPWYLWSARAVEGIIIGDDIELLGGVFGGCYNLEYIVFSESCFLNNTNNNVFLDGTIKMKGLVLPRSTDCDRTNFVTNNSPNLSLRFISFPPTLTKMNSAINQPALEKLTMPSITGTTSAVITVNNMRALVFDGTYTTIPQYGFASSNHPNSTVKEVWIPATVTSITQRAWQWLMGLEKVHAQGTTPPTLGNTNAFNLLKPEAKILVSYSADHSVLNAYKAATNWSTLASKIEEEPQ